MRRESASDLLYSASDLLYSVFTIGYQAVRPLGKYPNYHYGGDLGVVYAIPEDGGAAGQSTRP